MDRLIRSAHAGQQMTQFHGTSAPPHSVEAVVLTLAELSSEQSKTLLDGALAARTPFDLTGQQLRALSLPLGFAVPQVRELINVLDQLYQYVNSEKPSGASDEERLVELLAALEHVSGDQHDLNEIARKLARFTVKNENVDRALKLKRLARGFLPQAIGFSSFVDIRPDYVESRNAIRSFLPVIQLRITTETEENVRHSHVMQLTPEALDLLRDTIRDIESKLNAATAHASRFNK